METTATTMSTTPKSERRRPGPRPQERVHLGARISPKTMARIDVLVNQRRESVTATSKNAVVEELLALALDQLEAQAQEQLPGM